MLAGISLSILAILVRMSEARGWSIQYLSYHDTVWVVKEINIE